MIETTIKALEDNLVAIVKLYEVIINYDNDQMKLLKGNSIDMDQLDQYLERKDDFSRQMDKLSDECGNLQQRIVDSRIDLTSFPGHNSHIKELLRNIDIKAKEALRCEQEAKKSLVEYISMQRSIIKSNRQNASKTQKYMQNIANASMAVESVIDTSKKI